jgi:hypothetical protein
MSEAQNGKNSGDGRDDRRAKALRENLKRRKAQARGRTEAEQASSRPADSGNDSNKSARPDEE